MITTTVITAGTIITGGVATTAITTTATGVTTVMQAMTVTGMIKAIAMMTGTGDLAVPTGICPTTNASHSGIRLPLRAVAGIETKIAEAVKTDAFPTPQGIQPVVEEAAGVKKRPSTVMSR